MSDKPVLSTIARTISASATLQLNAAAARMRASLPPIGTWPLITSAHASYFYTLRAKAHADRDLVNMLLSELSTLDVRQLFICHKELFYHLYRGWPEVKKALVADYLEREYQIDKAGMRRRLFGPEPGMADTGPGLNPLWSRPSPADIVATVGPWGAIRKERR